jgi:hypothetical protein
VSAALQLAPGMLGLFHVRTIGKCYDWRLYHKMGKAVLQPAVQLRSMLTPATLPGKLSRDKRRGFRLCLAH